MKSYLGKSSETGNYQSKQRTKKEENLFVQDKATGAGGVTQNTCRLKERDLFLAKIITDGVQVNGKA